MLAAALLTLITAQVTVADGRAVADAVARGQVKAVWRRSSPSLKASLKTPAELARHLARLRRYGEETRVIDETLETAGSRTVYRRPGAYTRWARGVTLTVTFDADGLVESLHAAPSTSPAPTVYGRYETVARLKLPFEGDWNVLWGGRTWADNRHAAVPDMRYALDLFIRREGSTSRGKGRRNEDYFCFRKPALAPAGGIVVEIHDGVPDNTPGRISSLKLYGNHVVIDHGTGEFSLLGHLARGSVLVRVGERVTAGQHLARVGNSGMSTEPHLHYQLMDAADWRDAEGLPAQFRDYRVGDRLVPLGEPGRGEVIAPAPPADVASSRLAERLAL